MRHADDLGTLLVRCARGLRRSLRTIHYGIIDNRRLRAGNDIPIEKKYLDPRAAANGTCLRFPRLR